MRLVRLFDSRSLGPKPTTSSHWADGGVTNAENLILLCRFHHGRIHTAGWTVEKTGPGQAIITHHDDHETQDDQAGRRQWRVWVFGLAHRCGHGCRAPGR